jgi:hypothetical protein
VPRVDTVYRRGGLIRPDGSIAAPGGRPDSVRPDTTRRRR